MTKDLIYLKGELQLWVRKFLVGNSQQCARVQRASLSLMASRMQIDFFVRIFFFECLKKKNIIPT